MNSLFRLNLLVLLTVGLAGVAMAQEPVEYSAQAEDVFSRAVEQFKAGQFEDASAGFAQVTRMFPPNQRTTAAYVMRAKSLLRLNEPLEAARTLRDFFSYYPSSSYVPDADYTMGLVYLKIERREDAVQSFLAAWRSVSSVRGEAFIALDRTLDTYMTVAYVQQLLSQAQSQEERAFFWLKIGEKDASEAKTASADVALDTLTTSYLSTSFAKRIADLRTRMEKQSNVKLGVLLPLMQRSGPSAVKELGTDIQDGIQLAVDTYNQDPSTRVKVTLEIRDTERDVLVSTRGMQELTSDPDVIGIIGPVFSNEVSAVASLANERGCPLVSPTANANGIAAASPYVYQANPDYETRGRAIARFAVETKGYHVLAILAPVNSFGKFMAEAFAAEALHLGAKVIAMEWYQRGAADLKSQLASIRKAGLKAGSEPMVSFGGSMSRDDIARWVQLGIPMERLDSLMNNSAVINATLLLGPDARRTVDSLGIPTVYDDPKIDSLEYPVTAIDGIYVPIASTEEIGIVSSQLVYYNIKCQILGSGEWNNLPELIANKRYCNNVIFESDNYVDQSDSTYSRFESQYVGRFNKRPGRNTLYGYDTAEMLLGTLPGGATTRGGLKMALDQEREFPGLHSKITFPGTRVNSWVWILQFSGDQIQRVDGFDVQ